MQKPKQLDFFNFKQLKIFGGRDLKRKRKTARPLSTKHPIHLTLRTSFLKLRLHESRIMTLVIALARKFGITIYEISLNSNHIHLLMKIFNRLLYRKFIQALTGILAKELKLKWLTRPFTRLVGWGKDFKIEAQGLIDYQPRGRGSLKKRDWLGNTSV